jgi:tripartite-type tricarboxylate transporter receptor subunit TctC
LGFVVPKGTPLNIVQKIQSDTFKVLSNPEIKKRLEEMGMEVVASKPEQFDAFIQSEIKKWARVISEARIESE